MLQQSPVLNQEISFICRLLVALWAAFVCPWYAVLTISIVIGLIATPVLHQPVPTHLGPVIGPVFAVALLLGGFCLGRGVFINQSVAVKTTRVLLGIGTIWFLFVIGLYLYTLMFRSNHLSHVFERAAGALTFAAVNVLCFRLLPKRTNSISER